MSFEEQFWKVETSDHKEDFANPDEVEGHYETKSATYYLKSSDLSDNDIYFLNKVSPI